MKKIMIALLTITVLTVSNFGVQAFAEQNPAVEKTVELTKAQQKELAVLHEEINTKKKELIQKYVEFGAISKDQEAKILEQMDHHYKMMQENGFQPPQHPHHKHGKSE